MAVLVGDSFDHYSSADAYEKLWNGLNRSGNITMLTGRFGGQGARINDQGFFAKTFPGGAHPATVIVNCAFRCNSIGNGMPILSLGDDSGYETAGLKLGASGNVLLYTGLGGVNGSGGTLRATGSGVTVPINTWVFIEWKITAATGATGSCIVRVNGTQVMNASSIITSSANAYFSSIALGADNGQTQDYDDLLVMDTTGSAPLNDLIGDLRGTCLRPAANGRVNQWTTQVGGTVGSHYTAVSETIGDDGTSYLEDATVGHVECFTLTALPANVASIPFVQMVAQVTKSDGGSRAVQIGVGNGTTESYNGTDLQLPGGQYGILTAGFPTNPLTAAAWAAGDFSTLQAAIKVTV